MKEQDKSQEKQPNEVEMTTSQKCPNVSVKSSAVEPGRVDVADDVAAGVCCFYLRE